MSIHERRCIVMMYPSTLSDRRRTPLDSPVVCDRGSPPTPGAHFSLGETHRNTAQSPPQRSAPISANRPPAPPGLLLSVSPTVAFLRPLSRCTLATPLWAGSSWSLAPDGCLRSSPPPLLQLSRYPRYSLHPLPLLHHSLVPCAIPPTAHRADRPGRTRRKTETPAPAWLSRLAYVSKERLSQNLSLYARL